jgi:hypothetical protein
MAWKINYPPGTTEAQARTAVLTWAFIMGAGDGNRTRTISLGIGPIHAVRAADQPDQATVSTRG